MIHMLKRFFLISIIFLVSVLSIMPTNNKLVYAQGVNDDGLNEDDLIELNLSEVINLNIMLDNLNLTEEDLLENNYRIKGESIGFINARDNEAGYYYNFYLVENEIEFYSVQRVTELGNAIFELYDTSNVPILSS